MDEQYSQKEENTFRQDLFRRMDVQDKTLARIESDGKDTKAQTIKTNGRVNLMEEKTKDYDELRNSIQGLANIKYWIMGASATILAIGSYVAHLEEAYIIQKAADSALSQINLKYNVVSK